jgi:DMSO/TMAO reductase YedYZ molybdopterin-dependent catalytic subunit
MTIDRRRFLFTSGGVITTALLAACDAQGPKSASRLLNYAERKNEVLERALLRTGSSGTASARARAAGDAFPSYFISDMVPMWDEAEDGIWQLEVAGMVKTPLALTLAQLMALPRVTQRVNHFCVEGWTATAEFTGVRVADLARLAGADRSAGYVDFASFDKDYHESWDRETAEHPETLIVYAKDGRPLSPMYGAPARVHSPAKLGYKNTKYLTKVVFLPARNGGYWSDEGYEWFGGT